MSTYNVGDETRCPACAKRIELATKIHGDDGPPELGTLTICIYCAALCQWSAAGLVRLAKVPSDMDPIAARKIELARRMILAHARKTN